MRHILIAILSSIAFSAAAQQQSAFAKFAKVNKAKTYQLLKDDSLDNVRRREEIQRAYEQSQLSYQRGMNTQLLDLMKDLNNNGKSSLDNYRYGSTLKIYGDTIVLDDNVNFKNARLLDSTQNSLPVFEQLMRDSSIKIQHYSGSTYEAAFTTSGHGLSLPDVPPHMINTTNEAYFKEKAETCMSLINQYYGNYHCPGANALQDLYSCENSLNPSTWKNRYIVRSNFIRYLTSVCSLN